MRNEISWVLGEPWGRECLLDERCHLDDTTDDTAVPTKGHGAKASLDRTRSISPGSRLADNHLDAAVLTEAATTKTLQL